MAPRQNSLIPDEAIHNAIPSYEFPLNKDQLDFIFNQALVMEQRRSHGYIELMVIVHDELNKVKAEDFVQIDYLQIIKRTGCLLHFTLPDVPFRIPFDVEFSTRLRMDIQHRMLVELEPRIKELRLEHQQLLSYLKRERNLSYLETFNRYNAHAIVQGGIKVIRSAQSKKYSKEQDVSHLERITKALELPNRLFFDLFALQTAVKNPEHPNHELAMKQFEESYFRGKIEALESYLKLSLPSLRKHVANLKQEFLKLSGLKPLDGKHDGGMLGWANNFRLLRMADANGINPNVKEWHRLKYQTFSEIQRECDVQAFDKRIAFIENLYSRKKDHQRYFSQLNRQRHLIEEKIDEACRQDSIAYQSIRFDQQLTVQSPDAELAESWLRSNRIKLHRLYFRILAEMTRLVEEHQVETMEVVHKIIHDFQVTDDFASQSARAELEELLLPDVFRRFAIRFQRTEFEDANTEKLNTLMTLKTEVSDFVHRLNIHDTLLQGKIRLAYPEGAGDFLERLYDRIDKFEHLLLEINGAVYDTYLAAPDTQVLTKSDQRELMRTLRRMIVNAILDYRQKLDLIKGEPYHERIDDYEQLHCPLEQQRRFVLTRDELQLIPPPEKIEEFFKQVLKTKGLKSEVEHDFRTKFQLIQANEDKLEAAAARLDELIVLDQSTDTAKTFRKYGLDVFHEGRWREEFNACCATFVEIADLQGAEPLVERFDRLSEHIREAQQISCPGAVRQAKVNVIRATFGLDRGQVTLLKEQLNVNCEALGRLQEDVQHALRELMQFQTKLGYVDDAPYWDEILNYDDLENLRKEYKFIDTVDMRVGKKFVALLNAYNRSTERVFNEVYSKKFPRDSELYKVIHDVHYQKFITERRILSKTKLAILRFDEAAWDYQVQYLIFFLTYTTFGAFKDAPPAQNLFQVFREVEKVKSQPEVRTWLRILKGRLSTRLYQYEHEDPELNRLYEKNRTVLLNEIDHIVKDKLDVSDSTIRGWNM
ncbi:hypothetical protein [Acanthopleuribacter pedis]|uniref:Uncharacterized protein n=1 Tax=Acanthopleuribacter pedis TaxID=442870 RepID=A0A8J7Q8M8_9BACT|nr:hypothetical protein [Acanthopleuribacter pedis]MBO1322552.1 hypothetical protein [Acanthopleuribacter pedis]